MTFTCMSAAHTAPTASSTPQRGPPGYGHSTSPLPLFAHTGHTSAVPACPHPTFTCSHRPAPARAAASVSRSVGTSVLSQCCRHSAAPPCCPLAAHLAAHSCSRFVAHAPPPPHLPLLSLCPPHTPIHTAATTTATPATTTHHHLLPWGILPLLPSGRASWGCSMFRWVGSGAGRRLVVGLP